VDLSDVFAAVQQRAYEGEAWRNIYTCDPAQDLFDDLVDPSASRALHALVERSRPAPQRQAVSNRESAFFYLPDPIPFGSSWPQPPWKAGRWGDGSEYGVWYGALSEKTSLREVHHHLKKEAETRFLQFPNTQQIAFHRAVFLAQVRASRLVDARLSAPEFKSVLCSDDYSACNALGWQWWSEGHQGILSFSARDPGGENISLFHSNALLLDKKLRVVRFGFWRNGECEISCREDITSAILGPG
jgi:hypothetical protein